MAKEISAYDRFKRHGGQVYTGMKVGRWHRWTYPDGEWKEQKVTPEEWHLSFTSKKRRHGRAPEGSGVPVGTQYHWYIVASQKATKLDANTYETTMEGVKYKLAHARADKGVWNISEKAQKKRLVKILKAHVARLEAEIGHAEQAARPTSRRRVRPGAATTRSRLTRTK